MTTKGAVIKWNDTALKKLDTDVTREVNRRLSICGVLLQSEIVEAISIPTAMYGPSAPGDPPHADTGALKKSIFQYVKDGVLYVGSPLDYAWFLEVGTSKMAPRPFLRSTLNRIRPRLIVIMKTGRAS